MPLEITYWTDGNGVASGSMPGAPSSSETRTISATSAQSGATPANMGMISIYATENARFAYGANPTATATAGANGHYVGAGERVWFDAREGYKVAGITPS